MYKLLIIYPATAPNFVFRSEDGAFIPINLANTDYAEYLKWLDAGNTPLPAEETP